MRTHSDPDISLTDFALAYGAVHSDPNDSSASDLGSDGDIDGSDLARFVAQI